VSDHTETRTGFFGEERLCFLAEEGGDVGQDGRGRFADEDARKGGSGKTWEK
jgi:hypothetical protein